MRHSLHLQDRCRQQPPAYQDPAVVSNEKKFKNITQIFVVGLFLCFFKLKVILNKYSKKGINGLYIVLCFYFKTSIFRINKINKYMREG